MISLKIQITVGLCQCQQEQHPGGTKLCCLFFDQNAAAASRLNIPEQYAYQVGLKSELDTVNIARLIRRFMQR